jgi:hypothetical protein
MTTLDPILVAPGEFYVVDRSQNIDNIIGGPFDSSEVANEEKRQSRREGVVGAIVLFVAPVDPKEVSA